LTPHGAPDRTHTSELIAGAANPLKASLLRKTEAAPLLYSVRRDVPVASDWALTQLGKSK
jgi:hypothetical protein